MMRSFLRGSLIGGWWLSPNWEISMVPASLILRLVLWTSINPPRARARGRVPLVSSTEFSWVLVNSKESNEF